MKKAAHHKKEHHHEEKEHHPLKKALKHKLHEAIAKKMEKKHPGKKHHA